jgi:DNA-directed RNA polymerase alpha subunit
LHILKDFGTMRWKLESVLDEISVGLGNALRHVFLRLVEGMAQA